MATFKQSYEVKKDTAQKLTFSIRSFQPPCSFCIDFTISAPRATTTLSPGENPVAESESEESRGRK